jgi:UDP-N-acetylmuramoylalanine--D-glutamate ligase
MDIADLLARKDGRLGNILILGYGISGRSAYRFLKDSGHNVRVFDDFEANVPDGVTEVDWVMTDLVIKSPSIPMMPHNCHPVVRDAELNGVPVISTFDAFALLHKGARIIGITGTNGKSTTAALAHHVLKKCGANVWLGGNYGIPYFDAPANTSIYILEMSSYELASSKYLDFEIGCVLNIERDHLEFHGGFEEYVKAKYKLLDHSRVQVVSAEDKEIVTQYPRALRLSMKYTTDAYAYVLEHVLFGDSKTAVLDLSGPLNLIGTHNHQNIEFVYAICRHFMLRDGDIARHIQTFLPLPHRMNTVRRINHIIFINDSKATNPESAARALKTFVGYGIYWLAGGRSKKTDPLPVVGDYLGSVQRIYLFGESSDEFERTFDGIKETVKCETISCALEMAFSDALHSMEQAVILLSPMCSSFDQFRNFEERGEEFERAVSNLQDVVLRAV